MKAAQQLSREPFPRFPGKIPGLGGSRNKTCIYPRIHHAKGTPMDLRRRLLTRLGLTDAAAAKVKSLLDQEAAVVQRASLLTLAGLGE